MWIGGRRPVIEALRAGSASRILVARESRPGPTTTEIRTSAQACGIPCSDVSREELRRHVADEVSQGVAADVRLPELLSVSRLMDDVAAADPAPLLLLLDRIQDPRNLGSLLRTADAAGVNAVVMTEHGTAPLSATTVKASSGALFHLRLAQASNLSRAVEALRAAGVWTYALDESGDQTIYDVDLKGSTAIIVGSEGRGVQRLVGQRADVRISIPMAGRVESLNASVAGAIALFEAARQRGQ